MNIQLMTVEKETIIYLTFSFCCFEKQFFLTMIDNIFLIFDLSTGKQLRWFLIIDQENTDSYKSSYEIRKWNENEFLL